MDTFPRAEALIDLAAIRHNVTALAERAHSAQVMAVVKADGYGHGLLPVAEAALAGGATWLGVAGFEEAIALRKAGITSPHILTWLSTPGEPYADAIAAAVDVSAYAPWQVEEIASAAATCGAVARVHLKVDTGLGRGGAVPSDWPDLLNAAARARSDGLIHIAGVWSHLARADEPGHPSIAAQVAEFERAVEVAETAGIHPDVRHLANSAATLTAPETHFDLVRPGIAVYGLSPVPQVHPSEELGIRPAMTLRARLALVKRVPRGAGVSYGHRYVTSKETSLGLVPLGYADGVPRAAGNTAPVWAAGHRRTIAGTVCMDQFVLDLDDAEARAGDEVVLFGAGQRGEPTAQDWADALDTLSYEIVTRVGVRVPRTYTGKLDS
jgi:alanine racemase